MKQKKYHIFVIDDHPLIVEAYLTALNYYEANDDTVKFTTQVASDCESGFKLITEFSARKISQVLVFLDIKLSPSRDGKILSGEDLGLLIRKSLPHSKIIVSTTFNDNYRLHSIFKNINPEGFLVKNDITHVELLETIGNVIKDPPYFSKTVIKLLRDQIVNDHALDHYDRKILYELSIGTRMKDLPNLLPLSIAGIEKRKRRLKRVFNVKKLEDKQLLIIAREKGFI